MLAASLALLGRTVVVAIGDGAFGFNAMEFNTVARHCKAMQQLVRSPFAQVSLFVGMCRAMIQATIGITGKWTATRSSLTRAATSPASREML